MTGFVRIMQRQSWVEDPAKHAGLHYSEVSTIRIINDSYPLRVAYSSPPDLSTWSESNVGRTRVTFKTVAHLRKVWPKSHNGGASCLLQRFSPAAGCLSDSVLHIDFLKVCW